MSIQHKFKECEFGDNYTTHNAILNSIQDFSPKTLFLGTFNPANHQQASVLNEADFFYGRNYFWPALFNIFKYQSLELTKRRIPSNGKAQKPLEPSFTSILEFTKENKISFADLILNVFEENTDYEVKPNGHVVLDGCKYNLINDSKKDGISGLEELDGLGEVAWNTDNIIDYISENRSIETVYFTRNPTGVYAKHWNRLVNTNYDRPVKFLKLYTPSGSALPGSPRMLMLMQHWLFNESANFDTIDHKWLDRQEINLNAFRAGGK